MNAVIRTILLGATALMVGGACSTILGIEDIVPAPGPGDAGTDVGMIGSDGGRADSGVDGGGDGGAIDASADAADGSTPPPCDLTAPFGTPVFVPGINTSSNDVLPRVTPDELAMYFGSDRPGTTGGSDIWVATRASRTAPFNAPTLVPGVNTSSTDERPAISGDQLTILLGSDRSGSTQIWAGTRVSTSQPFPGLSLIPGIQASGAHDTSPALRSDGQELWFASDRTGGGGGLTDIWRAPGSGVAFASPVAVTELNTAGYEAYPYLSTDGLTIFWTSDRADGNARGSGDIWTAHRTSLSSPFTGLANVQELNTSSDESMGSVSVDGCRIYFSSNRPGVGGGADIYVAERPRLPPCDLTAPFETPTLVPGVNSTSDDFVAQVTPDELAIYFGSSRPGGAGGYDIWVARRATRTSAFGAPLSVAGINTSSNEYYATISPDELTIFVDSDQTTPHRLRSATRASTSQPFTNVAFVPGIQSGNSYESQPFLRADGQELWFTSDRGHPGGNYIFRASGSGVSFSNPVEVPEANGNVGGGFPALSSDGLTLLFNSGGRVGNIWTARRSSLSASFSSASDVVELNSASTERAARLSADGCRVYFDSDRASGVGGSDIYLAERPAVCSPNCGGATPSCCGGSCVDLQSSGKNCGACGHDCLGGSCQAGVCQPFALATGQQGAQEVAVDSTSVYWTNYIAAGSVMKCAIGGCNSTPTLLASGQNGARGIAVDATNVYWTNYNGNTVMKCAVGGCGNAPTPLASPSLPTSIKTDGTNVYWVNDQSNASVMKCGVGGCSSTPTPIAPQQGSAAGIAVDATSVYWGDYAVGTVLKCGLGGCSSTPVQLASGQGLAYVLAVDATNAYWTSYSAGTVMKCAVGGCGNTPTQVVSGQAKPLGIVVDSQYVYWTNNANPGTVMRCAIGGCNNAPTAIASGQNLPDKMAIDAASIYWTTGDGQIMRLAK